VREIARGLRIHVFEDSDFSHRHLGAFQEFPLFPMLLVNTTVESLCKGSETRLACSLSCVHNDMDIMSEIREVL
jgi:hypothetical protein